MIERWWLAVPTTSQSNEVLFENGQHRDVFKIDEGTLEVTAVSNQPIRTSLQVAGNSVLGRGARGPVPLHLIYEINKLRLSAGQPATLRLSLRVEGRTTND